MPKDRTFFTPKNIDHFLQCLRKGLTMKAACDETGFTKHQIRHFRTDNNTFDQQIKEAIEEGTEALEDEALRRAQWGVDEPVFFQGEICGSVKKYSDVLLMFLLKARAPEKYRERQTLEHTGVGGEQLRGVVNVMISPPVPALPHDPGDDDK